MNSTDVSQSTRIHRERTRLHNPADPVLAGVIRSPTIRRRFVSLDVLVTGSTDSAYQPASEQGTRLQRSPDILWTLIAVPSTGRRPRL
jgi:hypothetical protein